MLGWCRTLLTKKWKLCRITDVGFCITNMHPDWLISVCITYPCSDDFMLFKVSYTREFYTGHMCYCFHHVVAVLSQSPLPLRDDGNSCHWMQMSGPSLFETSIFLSLTLSLSFLGKPIHCNKFYLALFCSSSIKVCAELKYVQKSMSASALCFSLEMKLTIS